MVSPQRLQSILQASVRAACGVALTCALMLVVAFVHAPSAAAQALAVSVREEADYTRIRLTWPDPDGEPARVTASVENGVLLARFNKPARLDTQALAEAAEMVAIARLDPDGRTLRLALREPVRARASASYNEAAIDLINPARRGDPAPIISQRERGERAAAERRRAAQERIAQEQARVGAPSPPLPLRVTHAANDDATRITFHWTQPVAFTFTAEPSPTIRFAKEAVIDLSELNITPPRGVLRAAASREPGAVSAAFTLEPGYAAEAWRDGAKVVMDIRPQDAISRAPPPATPDPAPAPPPVRAGEERPRPPPNTVVSAQAVRAPGGLDVAFPWPVPVGAAAFRRGDALWIVFDAPADLDANELSAAGGRLVRSTRVVRGADHAAVRLSVADTTQIAVRETGARWVFTIAEVVDPPEQLLSLNTATGDGEPARLIAGLPDARIARVEDPAVGDTLLVAAAPGPPAGLPAQRRFMELAVLASAHGLALEVLADDITARANDEEVVVWRPGGLAITPTAAAGGGVSTVSATPGFVDFAGLRAAPIDVPPTMNDALALAAEAEEPAEALLDMARVLLAHELAPEAVGVLEELIRVAPIYLNDPRVRALRGAGSLLIGRLDDAQRDLSLPALSGDPAAALWRSYLAVERQDWRQARREFQAGEQALFLYDGAWQAVFKARAARAALELGDFAGAKALIDEVLAAESSRAVAMMARLVLADYHEGLGALEVALAENEAIARSGVEAAEIQALFNITRLRRALGQTTPEAAVEELEQLRLRWRGDAYELTITRELASIYLDAGRYRDGLALMGAAVTRFPNDVETRQISMEMTDAFRALFLDGGGATLGPVEALALWYEFRDLTPVGADGDRMIRRLVDRLVDFDLLPQAAELLEHQVDNRLRGPARSIIATDLAAIYLMNRNPEAALNAIARTRLARLPENVNAERRLIQARALSELGRHDHALELLSVDRSPEGARLRAEIAWRRQDWPQAGALLAAELGETWRLPGPLTAEAESRVLKAAVAMLLAGQEGALAQLRDRYGVKMRRGRQGPTWALIVDDIQTDGVRLRDLARQIASEDTLNAFVEDFRARRAAQPTLTTDGDAEAPA